MKISIFSKLNMAGGSEFRCAELCNGLSKFTDHEVFLLAEKNIPKKISEYLSKDINVIENCFLMPEYFYNSDVIVVINTDSRDFSTLDYWTGKSPSHNHALDMEKMRYKKMFFLYNFIVSPSMNLCQLEDAGINVGIFTTNYRFFDEITSQDRYERVRLLPRDILTSPIDPDRYNVFRRDCPGKVCFGMHSKRLGNKWNDDIEKLVKQINERYTKDQVEFRFMGIKDDLRRKIGKIENVTCLKEDQETVKDFISTLDVFMFFPDYKREEPWGRVIAEAMVSGCPVIALDKGGTKDQVLKYNNGFLCKKYDDYFKWVVYCIEHKDIIPAMSSNSIKISKEFYTEQVIKKLVRIVSK